jgi:cysteine-rich repeat protein
MNAFPKAAVLAVLLASQAFGTGAGSTVNITTNSYSVYSDRITEVHVDGNGTYAFPDPRTAPELSQASSALATGLDELGYPMGTSATVQSIVSIGNDEVTVHTYTSNYNPVDNPDYVIGDPEDYLTWIAIGDEDVNVFAEFTTTYYTFHRLNAAIDSACGDGALTAGEDCDDGNAVDDGNCCSATCQYVAAGTACSADGNACTPDVCDGAGVCAHGGLWTGCLTALSAKLQISDSAKVGKDKLSWQWSKGAAFTQNDLGNPTDADAYALCIFDTSAGVPSLAATIDIAPSATKWFSKDPKGFQYKDKEGASDGVTKAQLKTGAAGKTKIKVSASTTNLTLPTPFDASSFFDQDTSVTVQLVGDAGTCWTSSFTGAHTSANTPISFKAKVK